MLNDATLIIPFHFSVTVIMTQPGQRQIGCKYGVCILDFSPFKGAEKRLPFKPHRGLRKFKFRACFPILRTLSKEDELPFQPDEHPDRTGVVFR